MSFATASVALTGAGIATNTVGAYWSAKNSKIALEGQAAIAQSNARIAELSAQSALNQGQREVGRLTLKAGQLKSSQRAALAANGVDLGAGNAAELQASTDIMKEIDRNTVEANAVMSAWGYRTQAMNFENEALVKRATARAISPGAAAASSLLSNSGQVAASWYSMNKAGAFDELKASMSSDPIGDLGRTRGWWGN